MATSAIRPSAPKVFARDATGLRKEAGGLDILIYNVNNQNIGLGVAFLLLSLSFYAGGDFPLSAVLATLLVIPLCVIYSRLSADMPRSGGDYVWVSRIFGRNAGPVVGFVVAWTWIVLAFTAIGAPMAFFTQLGLSGMLRGIGASASWHGGISVGNWLSGETGTIIVGTVVLALFTAVMIRGVGFYMRIQRYAFILAMLGLLVGIVVALVTSRAGFAGHFDQYILRLGGPHHAYATALAAAGHHAAGYRTSPTFYAMLWTLYMVLFCASSCYIGGEVRQAARTQRVGMFGSLALTGIAITVVILVMLKLTGSNFLEGVSSIGTTKLGLGFTPTYNELLSAAAGPSVVLAIVLGVTFLFWTYVWMPINYFTATRLMLALSLDGYLPRSVSKVHPRRGTPVVAIAIAALIGEASLILYVDGTLSVLTLTWSGVVIFAVAGLAAILYPFRMRAMWESGGAGRLLGIPIISIWGALQLAAMITVLIIFWNDPAVGIGHNTKEMWFNIGLPLLGLLVVAATLIIRRSRGVDLRLTTAEIPPA